MVEQGGGVEEECRGGGENKTIDYLSDQTSFKKQRF